MKKIQRKRRVQPPAQRKPVLQPVSHGSTSVSPMCGRRCSRSFNGIVTAWDTIPISLVFVRTWVPGSYYHVYQSPCSVSRALASAEQEGERERENLRKMWILYSMNSYTCSYNTRAPIISSYMITYIAYHSERCNTETYLSFVLIL